MRGFMRIPSLQVLESRLAWPRFHTHIDECLGCIILYDRSSNSWRSVDSRTFNVVLIVILIIYCIMYI